MALFSVFIFALKIRERRRACLLSNPATFLFEILLKHLLFSSFLFHLFVKDLPGTIRVGP